MRRYRRIVRTNRTVLRVHHSGAEGDGGLAEAMRDSYCRDAIDRSLLCRGIRHSGTSGFRGVPGECAGNQESAGAQKRRAGEPMVDEATVERAKGMLAAGEVRVLESR